MAFMDGRSARFRALASVALVITIALAAGCAKKPAKVDFNKELPPGKVALRKLSPGEYPDFSKSTWNLGLLPQAADYSIDWLNHPSSQKSFPYLDISHERALATAHAFKSLIIAAQTQGDPGSYINQQIHTHFEVYKSIGAPKPDGPGYTEKVLFTGYFTPIYDASLRREGPYQYPLYKRPKDLATDRVTGETIGRKLPEGAVVPYWTRQQIEGEGKLPGHEFVWLKSRWEAYVITVQGSARLRLPSGHLYEIGYAGHNGHEYTSPGRQMVADGLLSREQLNIKAIGQIFAANPSLMDKYLWLNARTVFFTERPGGPYGALNEPVTTFATIATDKTVDATVNMTVYPKAMPAFLDVLMPKSDSPEKLWEFRGFMMDQDTGGAIRASGRCDIYMGVGEEGERVAGHQLNEGELYYIAIKPHLIPMYAQGTVAQSPQ
jgi:membrane-bound lytic murein transglycosylase A